MQQSDVRSIATIVDDHVVVCEPDSKVLDLKLIADLITMDPSRSSRAAIKDRLHVATVPELGSFAFTLRRLLTEKFGRYTDTPGLVETYQFIHELMPYLERGLKKPTSAKGCSRLLHHLAFQMPELPEIRSTGVAAFAALYDGLSHKTSARSCARIFALHGFAVEAVNGCDSPEVCAAVARILIRGGWVDRALQLLPNALTSDENYADAVTALAQRLNQLPYDRHADTTRLMRYATRQVNQIPILCNMLFTGNHYEGARDPLRYELGLALHHSQDTLTAYAKALTEIVEHPLAVAFVIENIDRFKEGLALPGSAVSCARLLGRIVEYLSPAASGELKETLKRFHTRLPTHRVVRLTYLVDGENYGPDGVPAHPFSAQRDLILDAFWTKFDEVSSGLADRTQVFNLAVGCTFVARNALRQNNYGDAARALSPIQETLLRWGLNPDHFIRINESRDGFEGWWVKSTHDKGLNPSKDHYACLPEVVGYSMRDMFKLEARVEGACRILNQHFYWHTFSRYPIEVAVRQAQAAKWPYPVKKPMIPCVVASNDHNGAQYSKKPALAKFVTQCDELGINVFVIEADSLQQALRGIRNLEFMGDRLPMCLVFSHGSRHTESANLSDLGHGSIDLGSPEQIARFSWFLHEFWPDLETIGLSACWGGHPTKLANGLAGIAPPGVRIIGQSSSSILTELELTNLQSAPHFGLNMQFHDAFTVTHTST